MPADLRMRSASPPRPLLLHHSPPPPPPLPSPSAHTSLSSPETLAPPTTAGAGSILLDAPPDSAVLGPSLHTQALSLAEQTLGYVEDLTHAMRSAATAVNTHSSDSDQHPLSFKPTDPSALLNQRVHTISVALRSNNKQLRQLQQATMTLPSSAQDMSPRPATESPLQPADPASAINVDLMSFDPSELVLEPRSQSDPGLLPPSPWTSGQVRTAAAHGMPLPAHEPRSNHLILRPTSEVPSLSVTGPSPSASISPLGADAAAMGLNQNWDVNSITSGTRDMWYNRPSTSLSTAPTTSAVEGWNPLGPSVAEVPGQPALQGGVQIVQQPMMSLPPPQMYAPAVTPRPDMGQAALLSALAPRRPVSDPARLTGNLVMSHELEVPGLLNKEGLMTFIPESDKRFRNRKLLLDLRVHLYHYLGVREFRQLRENKPLGWVEKMVPKGGKDPALERREVFNLDFSSRNFYSSNAELMDKMVEHGLELVRRHPETYGVCKGVLTRDHVEHVCKDLLDSARSGFRLARRIRAQQASAKGTRRRRQPLRQRS